MSKIGGEPYDGKCPCCGHEFTLADLGRMARGDGWERYFWVRHPNGAKVMVSFSEFNSATMIPCPVPALEQE